MRLAPFPAVSPWFRENLGEDGEAEVRAAEPAAARVTGVAHKSRLAYAASISLGDRRASGNASTATGAFRIALRAFHEPPMPYAEGDEA